MRIKDVIPRMTMALVLLTWAAPISSAADYTNVVIADAHVHLLDFLQNGDYLENGKIVEKVPGAALPSGQRGKRIEAVLWAMDRANVSHALVSGMPFLKKWSEDESFRPAYYLDATSRVVRARDTDYHVALAIEDYQREGGEAARVQLKIESEFPRFTQHIFEKTYPQYLSPLPSMAVVKFEPKLSEGDLGKGPVVPRGSVLKATTGSHLQTNCKFTTGHEVQLWPLEIVQAEYHTRDLSSLDLGHIPGARAAVRVRLRATAGLKFEELPMDRLVLHLCGTGGTPTRLYEQLMAHVIGVAVHPIARPPRWVEFLPAAAVREFGFEDDQALLPNVAPAFQGYRLLQE